MGSEFMPISRSPNVLLPSLLAKKVRGVKLGAVNPPLKKVPDAGTRFRFVSGISINETSCPAERMVESVFDSLVVSLTPLSEIGA
jgi:hypothetical protein